MDGRRYMVELAAAILAYAVMLVVSLSLLEQGLASGGWRITVAVMPMLPAGALCWVVLRQLRRMDELQRRLQLEALSLAFAGTALMTFSYGFLENVGFPSITMFAVWPLMAILWVIALAVCRRGYV